MTAVWSQQAGVLLSVVMRVSFEGQVRRVVTDPRQEDDDGADGHHRGNQEETESVHRTSDPTPVIFLLRRQTIIIRDFFYSDVWN